MSKDDFGYADARAAEHRGPCTKCGTSDAECMRIVVACGEACCKACRIRDTHPLESEAPASTHDPLCDLYAPPDEPGSWGCQCALIGRLYDSLRLKVQRLPEAAFALTSDDPSPLIWKSDVLDLLNPATH